MPLPDDLRNLAFIELRAMRHLATLGVDVIDLVAIPDTTRQGFERFCAEHPSDPLTRELRRGMALRDWILQRLEEPCLR